MKKLLIIVSFCCFNALYIQAQDIHFSQFERSYLNLNPALTGSFDGDYRFNGNFKNQWSTISETYQTFSVSAEAKSPLKDAKNFNLGLSAFNDEAGIGGLQTTQIGISIAYNKGLNKDSSLIGKVGIQTGTTSRSINFNRFTFDQQYNGRFFDPSLANGEQLSRDGYTNIHLHAGAGIELIHEPRKKAFLNIAFFNLTSPNQGFLGSNIPLDLRTTINGSFDYYISQKMDLLPAFIFSKQGSYKEVVLGSEVRYRLNGSNYLKRNLYGGVWYRNTDALIVSAAIDYHQWQLGASYDINISDLEIASNNRGGLELAITYIFKDFKPTIRRYKACPLFL